MSNLALEQEAKSVLMDAMPRGWTLGYLMGKLPLSLEQAEAVQVGDTEAFSVEQLRGFIELVDNLDIVRLSAKCAAMGEYDAALSRYRLRLKVVKYAFGGDA